MLGHAFEVYGYERVMLKTDVANERSSKAIARLGASKEGVLRHHMKRPDGSWRDSVVYSILLDEWPCGERKARDGTRQTRGRAAVIVLVIGGGAREHAICLALSNDPASINSSAHPATPASPAVAELRAVDLRDNDAIADLAVDVHADLVVIGPEIPLVAGVVDAVSAKGIACFGPTKAAAQLEGSKAFAKEHHGCGRRPDG